MKLKKLLGSGIKIAHIIESNYCRREALNALAEGAKPQETLRQKDCNNSNILERSVCKMMLTEGGRLVRIVSDFN